MDPSTLFTALNDGCGAHSNKKELKHNSIEASSEKEASAMAQNCFSVQRLIYISRLYQQQHERSNFDAQFASFMNGDFDLNEDYCIVSVLNDFHHMLSHHRHDLESIHALLRSTNCDVNTCYLLLSNDVTMTADKSDTAIFQILDSIHRHLYHTFDFGFECTRKERRLMAEKLANDVVDDARIDIDLYLLNLKECITSKKQIESLMKHKNRNKNNNKYTTGINESELCEHDGRIGTYAPYDEHNGNCNNNDESKPELTRSQSVRDDYNENKIYSPIAKSKKRRQSSTFYNSQKYRTTDEKWKVYSFGKKWRYEERYANDDAVDVYNGGKIKYWFVCKKYDDLKKEMLCNKLCSLSRIEWQTIVRKAQYLLRCVKGKKEFAPLGMSLKHLIALCLYNDCVHLCRALMDTYHACNGESDEEWRERHSWLYHFAQILTETVNTYGSYLHQLRMQQKGGMYHNISCKMVFKSTMINFLGPTSFSSSLNVGLQYSNSDGLLLQLYPFTEHTNGGRGISTKMIACDWICNGFSAECEYLSIGNTVPVKTKSIISICGAGRGASECHNYEYYLAAIHVLNLFIHNKKQDAMYEMNDEKMAKAISDLITNQCLRYNNYDESNFHEIQRNYLLVPKYIDKLFAFWINSIRSSITINLEKSLTPLFMTSSNMIDIDLILTLFRKVKRLKIWCKSKLRLTHSLIASFLNFFAFLDSKSKRAKIKEIEIIKPSQSEKEISIQEIVKKYQAKFEKLKWILIENRNGLYPVLSIHKMKKNSRSRSKTTKGSRSKTTKGSRSRRMRKKHKTPSYHMAERNLRPSLSLSTCIKHTHNNNHRTFYQL